MENQIGRKTWVVAEGYIPSGSHGPEPEMQSHESISILNAGSSPAHIELTIFYEDRDPAGPYRFEVGARRSKHVRFNDLKEPETIPAATPYSSLIESNVPIVVQHTRLDSRQAENALLSTIAYSQD